MRLSEQGTPAGLVDFAAGLADEVLPPLSEGQLRKVRARLIAKQLFVGEELRPWPEEEEEN